MIDKIKVILAICISTFLLGIGMTYAWYTWQSDSNTNISFKIMSMADVSFATGNDINVDDLAPVLDYKDGKMTSFSINNKKEQTFTGMVNLEITTIDENLRVEDFKYVLLSSNDNNSFTEIANGNFKDQGPQTITIKEIEVNPGITYYQFIIYIDGNMENNINMMNKQFVAKLMVEVKGVSDILDSCADEEWVSGAEGLYKDGNGNCRYIGASPDNWIKFNDDMYRIIGIFDGNTHKKEQENLLKLIYPSAFISSSYGIYNTTNDSGTYSNYSNSFKNDTQASPSNAYVLLNEYFYNKTNTSGTYGDCNNWTYFRNSDGKQVGSCDKMLAYGIKSEYQDYIESNVTWYLYGNADNTIKRQEMYLCERGLNGCTSANGGASSESIIAPIGLMYPSDYSYASGKYSISEDPRLSEKDLGIENWLFTGYEWIITPSSSDAKKVFQITDQGLVDIESAYHSLVLRPVFYLKSDVKIINGSGSYNDPYEVSL